MRALSAFCFLTIAACQPAAETDVATPVTPAAIVTPDPAPTVEPAGIVIGGVDLSKPARAIGTEPFWGVEITQDDLTFTGVDRPEITAANPGAQMQGDSAVIAAKDAGGDDFIVNLTPAQCSDGMSDWVYPLRAEVQVAGQTFQGCADSQAALDARPRP